MICIGGAGGKLVARATALGYWAYVWCRVQARRIGNVVQLHNVPNAVRWRGRRCHWPQGLGRRASC